MTPHYFFSRGKLRRFVYRVEENRWKNNVVLVFQKLNIQGALCWIRETLKNRGKRV